MWMNSAAMKISFSQGYSILGSIVLVRSELDSKTEDMILFDKTIGE